MGLLCLVLDDFLQGLVNAQAHQLLFRGVDVDVEPDFRSVVILRYTLFLVLVQFKQVYAQLFGDLQKLCGVQRFLRKNLSVHVLP